MKQNNYNNIAKVFHDWINKLYKRPLENKLYDLFKIVFVETNFLQQPNRKLQKRLGLLLDLLSEKYDKAAYNRYLFLMNNYASCLILEIIQILLNLAKKVIYNKSRVS